MKISSTPSNMETMQTSLQLQRTHAPCPLGLSARWPERTTGSEWCLLTRNWIFKAPEILQLSCLPQLTRGCRWNWGTDLTNLHCTVIHTRGSMACFFISSYRTLWAEVPFSILILYPQLCHLGWLFNFLHVCLEALFFMEQGNCAYESSKVQ